MPLRESHQTRLDHATLARVEVFEQMNYELVHQSAGGVGSLSMRAGYASPESLANEVCTTNQQYKFGVLDWLVCVLKTSERDRKRHIESLLQLIDYDKPERAEQSHASAESHLMQLMVELGEATQALNEAREDGRFDSKERVRVAKEVKDVADRALLMVADVLQGCE